MFRVVEYYINDETDVRYTHTKTVHYTKDGLKFVYLTLPLTHYGCVDYIEKYASSKNYSHIGIAYLGYRCLEGPLSMLDVDLLE